MVVARFMSRAITWADFAFCLLYSKQSFPTSIRVERTGSIPRLTCANALDRLAGDRTVWQLGGAGSRQAHLGSA